MTGKVKDISGQQFGSLTAKQLSHKGKDGTAYWVYQCACGKQHIARANTITHQAKNKQDPELPSCGCVELARKTKHGFRKAKDTHPAYRAYCGMMNRCYNPSNKEYKWYGAVGITVCDAWRDNPEAFVQWSLVNGWKSGMHIDKDIKCKEQGIFPHIYSPETCQWVSAKINVSAATNRDNYGKHPNVRLSHEDVAKIEQLYFSGEITNQSELARMFGLQSPSSVSRLILLAKARSGVTP